MASGMIDDATILVGKFSQYTVGRKWATYEPHSDPVCYGFLGWREDAIGNWSSIHSSRFPPLASVIADVLESALKGYWKDRKAATMEWLRVNPWGDPSWDDGLDWTMGARSAANHSCGHISRTVDGLLSHPDFIKAWEDAHR